MWVGSGEGLSTCWRPCGPHYNRAAGGRCCRGGCSLYQRTSTWRVPQDWTTLGLTLATLCPATGGTGCPTGCLSSSPGSPDESVHHFFGSAGNHRRDQKIRDETFLLSNMTPQVGRGFNRDKWEHLERCARNLTNLYRCVHQPQVWWGGISSVVGLPSYTSRL